MTKAQRLVRYRHSASWIRCQDSHKIPPLLLFDASEIARLLVWLDRRRVCLVVFRWPFAWCCKFTVTLIYVRHYRRRISLQAVLFDRVLTALFHVCWNTFMLPLRLYSALDTLLCAPQLADLSQEYAYAFRFLCCFITQTCQMDDLAEEPLDFQRRIYIL